VPPIVSCHTQARKEQKAKTAAAARSQIEADRAAATALAEEERLATEARGEARGEACGEEESRLEHDEAQEEEQGARQEETEAIREKFEKFGSEAMRNSNSEKALPILCNRKPYYYHIWTYNPRCYSP